MTIAHEVAHIRQAELANQERERRPFRNGWKLVEGKSVKAVEHDFRVRQSPDEAIETVAECWAYTWSSTPVVQPYSFYIGKVIGDRYFDPERGCADTMEVFLQLRSDSGLAPITSLLVDDFDRPGDWA